MKIGYCAPACYIREVKEAGFDYIELPLCSIAAETDQSFEKILAQLKSENLPCLASNMFLPKSVRVTGNDVAYELVHRIITFFTHCLAYDTDDTAHRILQFLIEIELHRLIEI